MKMVTCVVNFQLEYTMQVEQVKTFGGQFYDTHILLIRK